MSAPAITVLLPVRDAAPHLAACLESLLSQTFSDFEVLALNHGSRDQSQAILERFAKLDSRIRIFESHAPSLPTALNQGLDRARGRLIARMDADDLCMPGRLQAQYEMFQADPRLDFCATAVEMIADGPISEGWRDYQTWVNGVLSHEQVMRELFVECPLPHPTWMLQRECFERLGGYEDHGMPEDYDFVLRAAGKGARFGKVAQPMLQWRDHGERHSRLSERYHRRAFFRLKALHLKEMVLKGQPCAVWGAGDRARTLIRQLLELGTDVVFAIGLAREDGRPTSAHGVTVYTPEQCPGDLPGPLIACVGGPPETRQAVRDELNRRKWIEGKDYWLAS